MNGTDVIVQVNTGTDVTPAWTPVAKQRGASLSEKNDAIDMSSKDGREYEGIAGRYSAEMKLDALYVPDDTAYMALKTALRDGTLVKLQTEEAGAATEQCSAFISELSSDYPDQDAATISATFTITGPITPAAAV